MGITLFIGVLVMNTMCRDPGDGTAFKGQGTAGGEEIFHPPWSLITAMREQAVIAHTNAEAAGNPPHNHANNQRLPGKKEHGGEGAEMKGDHDRGYAPVNW